MASIPSPSFLESSRKHRMYEQSVRRDAIPVRVDTPGVQKAGSGLPSWDGPCRGQLLCAGEKAKQERERKCQRWAEGSESSNSMAR